MEARGRKPNLPPNQPAEDTLAAPTATCCWVQPVTHSRCNAFDMCILLIKMWVSCLLLTCKELGK